MLRVLIFILGLIGAAWAGGLGVFVESIEAFDGTPVMETETDAIVVLTGGSERVNTGYELLAAHKGKKLFISGVHRGLTLDHMPNSPAASKDLRDCCVVLGHEAETTFGNAHETHDWMTAENYRSLRLVTANYHMPRSLLVFHKEMPEFIIVPQPVSPDNVKLDKWWERPGTASLLVTEYNKYLVAIVRLWIGDT